MPIRSLLNHRALEWDGSKVRNGREQRDSLGCTEDDELGIVRLMEDLFEEMDT